MMPNHKKRMDGPKLQATTLAFVIAALTMAGSNVRAQQPGPLFRVNAEAVQGVGPGKWPQGQIVNLYVSPSGNDSTGDGTAGNPYQTIGRALEEVPAFVIHQYVINLAPGTYREEVRVGGRYFAMNALTSFRSASIELKGDPADPDSYVISGADAGAPTVPVRNYSVACSFAHCSLNGVSLQYAAKAGFFQQGGYSVINRITSRHHTSLGAKGLYFTGKAFADYRGDSIVSDVYNGIVVEFSSQFIGFIVDPLNGGFSSNSTLTVSGVTEGVGVFVYDARYEVSSTTSVSCTGVGGSRGVSTDGWAVYDSEQTTISNCSIGLLGSVYSRIEANSLSISNATQGVYLRQQSRFNSITSDPVFTNVTTPWTLEGNSWAVTANLNFFDGKLESIGNILLTPAQGARVGIGTASPGARLDIRDTTDTYAWIFNNNASAGIARLRWLNSNYNWSAGINASSNFQILEGDATARLSIFQGGKVEIDKGMSAGLNSVSFSTTPTFNAALGNTQKITLGGNVTSSTLSNASAGQWLYFIICQDATGNRTFSWPSNVKGGMTIGSTASTCSAQSFVFDGTNAYALSTGVTNQ